MHVSDIRYVYFYFTGNFVSDNEKSIAEYAPRGEEVNCFDIPLGRIHDVCVPWVRSDGGKVRYIHSDGNNCINASKWLNDRISTTSETDGNLYRYKSPLICGKVSL